LSREEKSGISVGSNGVVNGYTLDGTESSVKIMITDTAGYTAVAEKELTPTVTPSTTPTDTTPATSDD